MQALCVAPDCVADIWPDTRDMIRNAMLRGGVSEFAVVERDVVGGGSLLWIAWDGDNIAAAAVTRLEIVNGDKIGTIVACGGEGLPRWASLRTTLEQHFRDEGCVRSRICGRRGWKKFYPDYSIRAVIMEKRL